MSPPLNDQTTLFLGVLGATQISGRNHEYEILPKTHKRMLGILKTENRDLWNFVKFSLCYEIYDDTRIVLKMPSQLHAIIASRLAGEISARYKSLLRKQNPELSRDTKTLIKNVRQRGSKQVKVQMKNLNRNKLHPDDQWGFRDAKPAGLILEVVHNQSFDDLRQKVKKYFVGTKFQVRMVIAIHADAEFGIGISVWKGVLRKAEGEEAWRWAIKALKSQERIEKEGGLAEEGHLAIELNCFGPRWKIKSFGKVDLRQEVQVPYATIVELVKEARESIQCSQSVGIDLANRDVFAEGTGEDVLFRDYDGVEGEYESEPEGQEEVRTKEDRDGDMFPPYYRKAKNDYEKAGEIYRELENKYLKAEQDFFAAEEDYVAAENDYAEAEDDDVVAEENYLAKERNWVKAEEDFYKAEEECVKVEDEYLDAEGEFLEAEEEFINSQLREECEDSEESEEYEESEESEDSDEE